MPDDVRSWSLYFYCAILAWPVLLQLVNAILNGPGPLVRTLVWSISHFVQAWPFCVALARPSAACNRGCISATGLSLGGGTGGFTYLFAS